MEDEVVYEYDDDVIRNVRDYTALHVILKMQTKKIKKDDIEP